MLRRRRELVLAAASLALLAACAESPARRSVPPAGTTASPTVSAPSSVLPTSASPSASVAPGVTPTASVAPAVEPGRPYVVGVVGDWGVDTDAPRQVLRRMTRFHGREPLDAVVTTGDNAYDRGTESESRFAWRMLTPFRADGTPIHPAIGNHDAATNGGATFMRVFGMRARWYTAEVGPVQFVVLDSTRVGDAGQLSFLKGVLAKPRPGSFRVVVFHHPGWSCSAHSPDQPVVDRWLPLLGTKVDLVLAGHNHTYERFRASNGTPYVTTGGGGARLYASNRAACRGAGRMQVLKTAHHAVKLVATRTALGLEAVGVDGTVYDSITLTPRR